MVNKFYLIGSRNKKESEVIKDWQEFSVLLRASLREKGF